MGVNPEQAAQSNPGFTCANSNPCHHNGSRMITTARKAPLRNGLRDISMDDFWKDPLIVADTLHEKLNGLPINPARHPKLAQQISTLIELLRAIGRRRYGRFSLLAAMDFFQAAHYFLLLADRKPDSQDNGYKDDAEILDQAFTKHAAEMREFEAWLRTQG
jgi:hypothetical protein